MSHSHAKHSSLKVLSAAIFITLIFGGIEALVGWWSGSLALLGDAGHMASDALSLAIAAFAAIIAARGPSNKHSYGLGRAEVVAAWISSMILLAISIFIIVEAVERLHQPSHVHGLPVIIVAAIGVLLNLLVAWMLSKGERNLNIRAALLHVFGDLLGSFAALIAGAVIYATGWYPIDPILAIVIGILIALSSLRLLKESLLVLMEGVPKHIDLNQVTNSMQQVDGVIEIHDLHI
nr:cation diffusion facilitator family transporter [Gammaproteobacteria bacterium]